MVEFVYVGPCCILNCSCTVDAADEAALFQNSPVACNTWVALPFTSQKSVGGCVHGFSWLCWPGLVVVAC